MRPGGIAGMLLGMPFRRFLPLILTPCALLAAPAVAGAAQFCVQTTTPCAVPLQNVATVEAAMTAAQNLPSADTIRIGPGVHAGEFTYAGGGALTLQGEGIGTTLLDGTSSQTLAGVTGDVTVRDLTVRAADMPAAVGVNLAGGTLERVRVEGRDGDSTRAVLVTAGGTLDGVEIDAPVGTALQVNGGHPQIRRSRIAGGVSAFDDDFTLSDSRLERKGIDGGGPAATFVLRNVLIAVDVPNRAGVRMANGSIDADHLTVVHRGTPAPGTPGVHAAPGASITLESSIVSGFPVSLEREASDDPVGPTDLIVRRSSYAFDRVVDVPGSSGGVIELGPGNVNTEGGFVGGGDYRLRGDAEQVDRGMLTGIVALDLGGFARTVDGDGDGEAHTDMGAYEYRRQAPQVTLAAPTSAVAGQPVAFSADGSDADGEPLSYSWSFGAAGTSATHAFAGSGPQVVSVTATDPTGRTATASATVDVAPAPAPPGADTTAPALSALALAQRRFKRSRVAPKPAASGPLALALSEPARVELRVERSAPGRKRGGTCVKGRGGKRCTRWVAVGGAAAFDLPAGRSHLTFRGSLGRKLAAGKHRLAVTAVDAAGNRSGVRRVTFTVTR